MGFSPRLYEIHLWLQDDDGDYWWEIYDVAFLDFQKALVTYNKYKDEGYDVRIVETKCVRAWEDEKEWK
jgi:hypothetical protein